MSLLIESHKRSIRGFILVWQRTGRGDERRVVSWRSEREGIWTTKLVRWELAKHMILLISCKTLVTHTSFQLAHFLLVLLHLRLAVQALATALLVSASNRRHPFCLVTSYEYLLVGLLDESSRRWWSKITLCHLSSFWMAELGSGGVSGGVGIWNFSCEG